VQLGAGAIVGPKFVAGSDRTVDDRGNPIVGAPRVERNAALSVAQSCDAAWRIVFIGCGALRRKESHRSAMLRKLANLSECFLISKSLLNLSGHRSLRRVISLS